MAADPAQRTIFVSSVVDFLQRYGFHGLDFDWEYPAYVELGGRPEDKVITYFSNKDIQFCKYYHSFRLTRSITFM